VRHALAWLFTLVFAAAGTLLAHALAYRVAGEPLGPVHGYLEHAPQVLLVLATLVACSLAVTRGAATPPAWPFPLVAVGAFVAQEHIERLAHTGQFPWLLTQPVFLLGVVLQLPVAIAAWALARRLLSALATTSIPRRRLLVRFLLAIASPGDEPVARSASAPIQARAPPPVLPAR
jgi:hypothetical protein